jgi:hypothetical protein
VERFIGSCDIAVFERIILQGIRVAQVIGKSIVGKDSYREIGQIVVI